MKKSISFGAALVALAGLAGCGVEAETQAEGNVSESAQELIIPCSPESDLCARRGMICDYGQGYCVDVCDDGEVCPTHRPCCN